MRPVFLTLACALLMGASAPEKPTPNAQPEATPSKLPSAGASGRPALKEVAQDPDSLAFIAAVDWGVLDGVIVQHAGRRKPLEAFARETLWQTLGGQTYHGQPPAFTVLSLCFDEAWGRAEVLKVGHPGLIQALGVKKASLETLGSEAFEILRQAVKPGENASPRDRAVLELERKATVLSRVATDLRVLPGPQGRWIGMGEDRAASASPPAFNAFVEMELAYRHRDAGAFQAAAAAWAAALREAASADYAALEGRIGLERLYHRVQPFRWACAGYFAAFMAFLVSWGLGRPRPPRWIPVLMGLAFLLHGAGITVRVAVAGRPPVSNMYEVILYVAWAVVAVSYAVTAVMRTGVPLIPASGLAALGLVMPAVFPFVEHALGQPMPLDPSIGQVQAVLKSNYWLTVHVCTITTSYAILFLGFGAGICHLMALKRPGLIQAETADRVAYRVNQLGFLFLTLGVLTGAWWANDSWGRYWGWDSKETAAFATWCVYAAYLHLRLFGILKARGAAWLTVLGFVAILFTMIGVGYFLPGLHSYA